METGDDHRVHLERDRDRGGRRTFEAVCACGWRSGPERGLLITIDRGRIHSGETHTFALHDARPG